MASNGMLMTLGDAVILVSPWKPVLLLLPFIPWAWLITTVYDKHATRFHLKRAEWNTLHLTMGLVAFLVGVAMPVQSAWAVAASFAAIVVILAIDLAIYPAIANKDERVPEQHRLTLNIGKYLAERREKKDAKQAGNSELRVFGPDKQLVPVPDPESPAFELRIAAEQLVLEAMRSRAERVEVRPVKEGTYGVVMTIDNVRTPGTSMPAKEAVSTIDFWKGAAGLSIEDRRRKQSGKLSLQVADRKLTASVKSAGAQGGMTLTIRIEPAAAVRRKSTDMGLLPAQLETLSELVQRPGGLVIVSAPAGQGGTTAVYTMTKMHDAYTQNVQTIEFEPEDTLEGVRQNPFDPTAEGMVFSTLVRSTLRRDPDVVAVLEVPDEATAKECVGGDMERARVYTLLRASDALKGLRTFIKAVGDPAKATDHLQGLASCRTIRKLCTNCRLAYQPTPDMLKKLGLPADKVKQLYKKSGQVQAKNKNEPETCPQCQGLGYFGTDAIFEIFLIDPEERQMAQNDDMTALRASLRKKGYPTMQQVALRKAVDGVTSIEEVLRVTGEGSPSAGGSPQQGAESSAQLA